jgi:hypothetical protein
MPGYVKSAYYGNLPTLKQEIHSAVAAGKMDGRAVVTLAEAVARRELRSARGGDALERISTARRCVRAVETELRERAATLDDAGASAMLVLADAGKVRRAPLVDLYGGSPQGAWRAVAARGTASPGHAPLRRTFYVDPDERVRRESFRAAFEAADPADLGALLEAARLDPDPRSRSLATRAVGAVGGAPAALGLADLWPRADRETELAIVEAWGLPLTLPAGGGAELLRLAESGASMASVAAAGELVRAGGEAARSGRAALVRAVAAGTTDERLVAILLAPLDDPAAVAALGDAAKSDDPAVRVVALARLLEVPATRKAALGELVATARGADAAARQARLALGAAADAAAIPLLEHDLATEGPSLRERAAVALFRLGNAAGMAMALADPDPRVRMAVACSVLGTGAASG